MAKNKEKKSGLVDITFDGRKLSCVADQKRIFGIEVEEGKKFKFHGKCESAIHDALKDAGRCD